MGSLQRSPGSLAGLRGSTSKGEGEIRERGKGGGEKKVREGTASLLQVPGSVSV